MPLGSNIDKYFQVGSQIGKANSPSSAGVSGVMDMFKNVAENKMKLQQQAGLFKSEKEYEYRTDPTKREAQAKLDASGYSGQPGSAAMAPQPINGGNAFTNATGVNLGGGNVGNVQTSFTDVAGHKFENQPAELNKQAASDLLKERSDMISAGAALDQIAKLNQMYEKGVGNAAIKSDPSKKTNILQALAGSKGQGASLAATRIKNPDWDKYESFRKNTSYFTDRYVWGEKGKLIAQQLDAGVQTLPTGETPKTTAYGKFSEVYDAAGRRLSAYNNAIKQAFGENSPYEVHPAYEDYISKTHDRAKGLSLIQSGEADPKKISTVFKEKYGEDL